MLKVMMTVGIPACGKSTWSKDEVRKDPEGTIRISRDDLRTMLHNYHFTDSNEKMVTAAKEFLLTHALKRGRNVILDETNLNPRNFNDVCKIVRDLNIDCLVMEKPFYIELNEAIERDAQRTGSSKVGEEVVRKFWKKSGGNAHKFYKPKVEVINRKKDLTIDSDKPSVDGKLPWCLICDLDGTLSLFNTFNKDGSTTIIHDGVHVRSPYDASKCDEDAINEPVAATIEAFYKSGYKIVFCSGREDCYRPQTIKFIEKHLGVEYQLFMRKSGDQRKDSIIKEEIYNSFIKPNYNVFLILDDRNQVVNFWRSKGLTCFQVAEGNF